MFYTRNRSVARSFAMAGRRRGRCTPASMRNDGFRFHRAFCATSFESMTGTSRTSRSISQTQTSQKVLIRKNRVSARCSAGSTSDVSAMAIEARTMAWARVVVCGLQLCPFAESVLDSNTVRVFVSDAENESLVKDAVAAEISLLISTTPAELSTTLLVLPKFASSDFLRFHELCGKLEERIEGSDRLAHEVMLACFHPQHQWGDSDNSDDAINFDKRAPYPVINFLRAPQVDQYIKEGKTQQILERNQLTWERMGSDRLKELYRSLSHNMNSE